jgi:hypothetical protein
MKAAAVPINVCFARAMDIDPSWSGALPQEMVKERKTGAGSGGAGAAAAIEQLIGLAAAPRQQWGSGPGATSPEEVLRRFASPTSIRWKPALYSIARNFESCNKTFAGLAVNSDRWQAMLLSIPEGCN